MRLRTYAAYPLSLAKRKPFANHVAYSEIFKDHIAHPRNAGRLENANARAEQTNPVCGDRIELSLRLVDNRIEAVGFLAYGCAPTLACASALAEMIQEMRCEEAARLTRQEIVSALGGLPSGKQHAAALAIEVLQAALTL
ncbi:MAG: nitrogen fixation protein NifU [Blastocatellia bacterium]|nr:nitrogen fixation protein NifU [Blastocatellia bacterium]